ncbi:MAG: phasin family protein [Dokdonella sp.]|jgi:Zn-dependent M32 family carboxypeptidase|uniref:phasin family protein n=1 Tax=Dokdonella sp. TaxID=2291710 RepID=UPI001B430C3B|nr:phasin family protein [Dokdonella sp.]MBK8124165.1 phasin family protein [Dokdonella sp.]MBP6325804.1 phasin family protein [Dokdonella sp.]HNV07758.1 phasin family protein [Dokdonella sp.]HPW02982.1 phasin family protein [Dokdonella sp.]HQV49221.1 phasin family protein [Dokdonella sp.]
MYEQINSQFLSLGKTFADAAVKAQGVALAGFEKIADVQLKAVEKQVNASSAFWSEASEIRDFDGAKAIWPKGVALAKESAEKLYNTNQELLGITLKTNEALGNLIKGSFEATNETVTKQVNAVKKAASGK